MTDWSSGSHSTGWNGQDAFEHAARAGVYLATLRMDGTVIGRTTVVLAR